MKKVLKISAVFILALGFSAYTFVAPETDYTDCLKKKRSEWGSNCADCKSNKDTYKVVLTNDCTEKIDVMLVVQESDKTWRKAVFREVAPKDSVIAYACSGTGKYKKWARKAGDNSIVMPTVEQMTKD